MEQSYGVGITNRYSCFLESDDDSPSDTIKVNDADKDKKKGKAAEKENRAKDAPVEKSPTAAKKITAPNTASSQNQRKGIRDLKGGSTNEQQQRTNRYPDSRDGGNRGPRTDRPDYQDRRPPTGGVRRDDRDRDNRDYREERNNRRNNDETREFRGEGGDFGRRGGGGFRGNRGGPFNGRGRGAAPYRKREFDRQSGSDKSSVKPIDKREGAGSRNWGTYKDDVLADGTNPSAEESMEEKTDSNNTTITDGEAGDAEKTENGTAPPADGEPKQMTLGEWKALQEKEAQSRPKPVFNLRKAGEGEDQSQWKNLTLKTKEKVGSTEEEEEEEYSGEFPQRAGRQKQLLDVNFHFADSRRGADSRYSGPPRGGMRGDRQRSSETLRGGRGFGGAPRGGGFRGGFRGGSRGYSPRDEHPARQTAPKVDDERDFPSLG